MQSATSTAKSMEALAVSRLRFLGFHLLTEVNQWPWTLVSGENILPSYCVQNRERAAGPAKMYGVAGHCAVKEIVTIVDVCAEVEQSWAEALGHGQAIRDRC